MPWRTTLVLGCLASLPFVLSAHLPLVDLPLHQLEMAIWLRDWQPELGFGQWYADAGYALPYWGVYWLGLPFAKLFGVEASLRWVVGLYAFGLPIAAALVNRASGRDPVYGLLLLPFVIDTNLAWGFVAYAIAGLCWLLLMAALLQLERTASVGLWIAGAVAALSLGYSHPQMAVFGVAIAWGFQVLADAPGRVPRAALASLGLLPTAVWMAGRTGTDVDFGAAPQFESLGLALQELVNHGINVWPGPVEELSLAVLVVLIALAWRGNRVRRRWRSELRFAAASLACLLFYLFGPWSWAGQSVAQRALYPLLLMLPMLVPTGVTAPKAVRVLIVAVALIGIANMGYFVQGHARETEAALAPVVAATPLRPRVMYIAHDFSSRWSELPVQLHTGALVNVRRGGVYARHFERLVSHHRPDRVPYAQLMNELDLAPVWQRRSTGEAWQVPARAASFWDTFVVRWRGAGAPPFPLRPAPPSPPPWNVVSPPLWMIRITIAP